MPLIASNKSEVIRCSGTRYTYSPNLLALGRCVAEGPGRKVAFVGTPCQILALRRMQKVPLKKFVDIVAFTVGLFCSESFTYDGLMVKKIQDEIMNVCCQFKDEEVALDANGMVVNDDSVTVDLGE
jgi:coenzyme F420 hydrogenase subunit beta